VTSQRAVFLDRDGTILHEAGYLSRREDVRWFPYAIDAIRLLNRAGFLVFVVTNQGGAGLGFFDEDFVRQTHRELDAELHAAGARVDGWFFCPHHPRAIDPALRIACDCRKPAIGMIEQARKTHAFDTSASFVVGDKLVDMTLAAHAGARGVFVKTGHGAAELARNGGRMPAAAHIAETVMEATSWMLRG
jgi:D-glycero-D-manno-heptose 1,7-bisphosphate phosphatase